MLKHSNTTSANIGRPITTRKAISVVGNLAMTTSSTSGNYSLYGLSLITLPSGHGLASMTPNLGTYKFKVTNKTKGITEKTTLPLNVLIVSGDLIFIYPGSVSNATGAFFADYGLTNPDSGDELVVSCMYSIPGYIAPIAHTFSLTTSP